MEKQYLHIKKQLRACYGSALGYGNVRCYTDKEFPCVCLKKP